MINNEPPFMRIRYRTMFDEDGTRVEIWITNGVTKLQVRTHPLGTFDTPTGPARVHEVASPDAAAAMARSIEAQHTKHFLSSWGELCDQLDGRNM